MAIKGVKLSGEIMELAPSISRPSQKTSLGVLGAIRWNDIKENYIQRLTAGDNWRYLHIVCDSAAVNYKMIRCIIADTMRFPKLLVSFIPCFAHILSLVVKWGLGRKFPYGSILRV